jgi:hypothetical protein
LCVWQQVPGTEYQVEGACWVANPVGLNCLVLTRQQRPWCLLVLGCGLPRAIATAADTEDPSLQAARVLGPACQVWASRSQRSCSSHRRTKLVGRGIPGACLLVWASGNAVSAVQWCCRHRGTKCGALSFCVCWEAGLAVECQVMEPGTMWQFQE